MGAALARSCHYWRRLDRLADRYEAAVDQDRVDQSVDRIVSLLLALWATVQLGALLLQLQAHPLF